MKLQLIPPLGFLAALGGAGLAVLWLLQTKLPPIAGAVPDSGPDAIAPDTADHFQLPEPFDTEEAVRQFSTRPLFAEGRRPFEPAPVEQEPAMAPDPEPVVEAAPAMPEPMAPPQIRLLGVMESGGIRRALIADETLGQQTWLAVGEAVQGWTMTEVGPSSIRLRVDDSEIAFNLFQEPVP